MKVALLHYASPPVVGGVEVVLARQAKLLADAGHQVLVVTGRGETWDMRIPVEVVPLVDSRHPDVLQAKTALDGGRVPPDFDDLVERILVELRALLSGMAVVIAHNVASLHKNLALTAALHRFSQEAAAPRLILWHHDLAWTVERYRSEIHAGIPWDLLRIPWPGVKQVVISEARRMELADLMGLDQDEITVIPAGVDLALLFSLSPGTQALVKQLQLDRAAPLLLTPVRLTRRKNLELGLRVLSHLRQRMPAAMLVITGPLGAHNPANEQYLKDLQALRQSLSLEGAAHMLAETLPDGLTEAQVAEFFRLADALLITSLEEGFGIPMIEAGLMRMPIFCSALATLRALGKDSATYFSLDTSPDRIATMIAGRLESNGAYRLRKRVRENYTWEAIYQRQIAPLIGDE